ncbi:hypothetical protein ACMT1E_10700 [Sphingomonas flavalba]|uniref:hypothetical protein n=1 Tax=Sphingomonas flavalba TaxID=2559804 RepID=UPI0039E14390
MKAGGSGGRAVRAVDPAVVDHMVDNCTGQTDETLQAQFGISYNTWRKLLSGQPIRRSLADRLEDRVSRRFSRAVTN